MSTIQSLKDGDITYTYFGGAVYKGQVFYDEKYPKGMRLDVTHLVYNGKEQEPVWFSPKELYVTQDELHLSAEEALDEGLKKRQEKSKKKFKAIAILS